MEPKDRIIVALDVHDRGRLLELIGLLAPHVGAFKFGLETVLAFGAPEIHRLLAERNAMAFIDGKLNDVPKTIAAAARLCRGPNVLFFNVHAVSGAKGIEAAVEHKGEHSKVLAVTVLTSIDDAECDRLFGSDHVERKVLSLAAYAAKAGADGIVCSPREAAAVRACEATKHLLIVAPAVRPEWAETGDHAKGRVMTPGEAVKAGVDYIVVGDPVLNPPPEVGSSVDAVKRIAEEIAAALG